MTPLSDAQALETRERLADGCHQLNRLLDGLLDSQGRVADEVHAIRKLGKSLRGGFSMFGLGKSSAIEIQAIGRLLAGPRDAISRYQTWTRLEWNEDGEVAAAIAGMLEQATHSAARRPPRETIAWCHKRVENAVVRLATLPTEGLGERVGKRLRKLERRAVRRCHKLSPRDPGSFHQARKALKAWLGASGLLPGELRPTPDVFTTIAGHLGDENDLTTLAIWLEEHGFTARFAPGLWDHLIQVRTRHQRIAMRKGADL